MFLALPIGLLLVAMAIALAGMLLTFIGLESAGDRGQRRLQPLDRDALRPGRVPTYVPRLAVLAALVAAAAAAAGIVVSAFSNRAKRRSGTGSPAAHRRSAVAGDALRRAAARSSGT